MAESKEPKVDDLKDTSSPTTPENVEETKETQVLADEADTNSVASDPESVQPGIQRADILKKAWSRNSLITAFAG
jgi:hypothetical protein